MAGNLKKEDPRIKKTHKALTAAMVSMLRKQNFNQITVNDLCDEALVSRATFYLHFNDKYDLLKYWLGEIRNDITADTHNYAELELLINQFVKKNKKAIINVTRDATFETSELIHNFMSSIMEFTVKRNTINVNSLDHIVLFNFCSGGLVALLSWQVKNNFPSEVNMMNSYLYELLECIMEWDAKQAQKIKIKEIIDDNEKEG